RYVTVPTRAQLSQELEAVAVAEAEVEEHAVDRLGRDEPARLAESGRGQRAASEPSHRPPETVAQARLVLDDQDGGHRASRPSGPRGTDSAKRVTSPARM